MYISDFHYHRPCSIEEACRILEMSEDGVPLAGGTDLLVEIKQGKRHHQDIVSLADIRELKSITVDENKLNIGAAVTLNELIASPILEKNCPVIGEAALTIATEQIRNTATIGGNLCTAASCCDMAPILIALAAEVELVSTQNNRIIPLKDFFIAHKKTVLKKGEILNKIIIAMPTSQMGACYKKFGLREAASIAVASVAAVLKVTDTLCTDGYIVMGAVAPTPKISPKALDLIKNEKLSRLSEGTSLLEKVGQAAAQDAEPIDDIRGSAEFRRNIIKVLTQRAVINATFRANSLRKR